MAGVYIKTEPGADVDSPSLPPAASAKPQPEPESEASYETNYLEQLVSQASTEQLENGVKIGVQLLDTLIEPLNVAIGTGDTQAAQWLKSIQQLQDEAKPIRTVVGVVGNTGAGKSSIINAVLDEERYVHSPTLSELHMHLLTLSKAGSY